MRELFSVKAIWTQCGNDGPDHLQWNLQYRKVVTQCRDIEWLLHNQEKLICFHKNFEDYTFKRKLMEKG